MAVESDSGQNCEIGDEESGDSDEDSHIVSETEAEAEVITEAETDAEVSETEAEQTENEEEIEAEIALTAAQTDNMCYVDGLAIMEIVDGTVPFDSDGEVGDDSSADNRIVRSFDYINYTLSYTMELTNSEFMMIPGAGTLSTGLYVGAASIGTVIQPTFYPHAR